MSMTPYYQDEAVCIYHGDCREVLPFLPKTDLLLTDPPYGIGINRSHRLSTSRGHGNETWDESPIPAWLLSMAFDTTRHHIVWGGNYYDLGPARCFLVWDKQNDGRDFADCEFAWTDIDAVARLFRMRPMGMDGGKVHPTQKPEALMRWCLLHAPDGCNVLDPFMGSGTTLVAAKRLGRKAIGIERERKYCDLAVERLSQGALGLELGSSASSVEVA
jgi:DNA modification methylase